MVRHIDGGVNINILISAVQLRYILPASQFREFITKKKIIGKNYLYTFVIANWEFVHLVLIKFGSVLSLFILYIFKITYSKF